MKRKKITCLACALAISSVMAGCGGAETESPVIILEQEQEETVYKMGEVTVDDVEQVQKIKCTYKQMKDQKVSFELGGKIVEKVLVKEGDTVKKGQLLAQLSGGNLDAQIENLEYRVKRNKLLLGYVDENEANDISERWVNETYNGRPGAVEDVKQIQENYRYQREDLQDAISLDEIELSRLKAERNASSVYAEIDGVVHSIMEYLEWSTSEKDKVIMTIIDSSECVFVTEESEFMDHFKAGEKYDMNLTGKNNGAYQLTPYKMEEWGDAQYFTVVSGPEEGNMDVGTSGYLNLKTAFKPQVTTVPVGALYTAGEEYFVYVVGENGMREVQWVKLGLIGNDKAEVLEGLQEGDKVILK